ncbi:tail fiber protein [Synechococcus phage S-H34]|uniref:Tail fiber protein n=1 Tax=Synechococcus phage S-H34 TaxID=2718942 RepID=A0A6G8R6Z5_9CAUD|nr:tail fiber protein [Synechococcus phage S-H34]QIN96930.1 tail fiber protein [Synechococcus phage S-H34]
MSGNLRLYGATSGYSQISAPDVAGDQIFVVPSLGGEVIVSGNNQSLDLGTGDLSAADGTFGSGNITLNENGSGVFKGNVIVDKPAVNKAFITQLSGVEKASISSDGSATFGSGNITLGADGSGTFSASLQIGPNAQAGDNPFLTVGSGNRRGTVIIKGPSPDANASAILVEVPGSSTALQVTHDGTTKIGGTSSDPNITLNANGNVTFAGTLITPGLSATASAGGALKIIGNEIYRDSSARATKENIVSLEESESVAVTKGLRPVNYLPKGDPDGHLQIGFIAEEVLEVCPPAAITENGEAIGVAYDRLTAICISALQQALTRIEALEAEVQALKDN